MSRELQDNPQTPAQCQTIYQVGMGSGFLAAAVRITHSSKVQNILCGTA